MSHMEELVKFLGLEFREEFELRYVPDKKFYFDEKGLKSDNNLYYNSFIGSILTGEFDIVKLPFLPKRGQQYYYIDELGGVCSAVWCDECIDYLFFNFGNCFKTLNEAEAKKDEVLKDMKSCYNNLISKQGK